MTSPFFLKNNRDYIFDLCTQFLGEKYNIELPEEQLRPLLFRTMNVIYEHYKSHPPMPSVDELNKRTIIQAKKEVLSSFVAQQSSRSQSQTAHQPQSSHQHQSTHTPQSAHMPTQYQQQMSVAVTQMPPPNVAVPSLESGNLPPPPISDYDDDGEEGFLKKLQELELQRHAVAVTEPQQLQAPISASVSGPSATTTPSTPPAPSTNTPTVLYVPTQAPIKSSKTIAIHGFHRMWDYFHDRFTFGWAGPIPTAIEGMSGTLEVAALMLPACVATMTPLVEVRIEGVGSSIQSVICIPNGSSSASESLWHVWRPISEGMSILKTIACPWTIQLLDAIGLPLDLGKDGFHVLESEESVHTLEKDGTRLVLSDSIPTGSVLMWQAGDALQRSRVVKSSKNIVEIEGNHVSTLRPGTVCGLWSKQSSLLLEYKITPLNTNTKI